MYVHEELTAKPQVSHRSRNMNVIAYTRLREVGVVAAATQPKVGSCTKEVLCMSAYIPIINHEAGK